MQEHLQSSWNLFQNASQNLLSRKEKIVNGSSLLGLMTLAASKGTEIKIQCIGENLRKTYQN